MVVLKGKMNWSSNRVKEGDGKQNKKEERGKARAGTDSDIMFEFTIGKKESSSHVNTSTHQHTHRYILLSDVEECFCMLGA